MRCGKRLETVIKVRSRNIAILINREIVVQVGKVKWASKTTYCIQQVASAFLSLKKVFVFLKPNAWISRYESQLGRYYY